MSNNWTAFRPYDFLKFFIVYLRFAYVNVNWTVWKIKSNLHLVRDKDAHH